MHAQTLRGWIAVTRSERRRRLIGGAARRDLDAGAVEDESTRPKVFTVRSTMAARGNAGYSHIRIWFNTQCIDDYDWYDTDGIDPGKISALAVALHEMGHALGMNHSLVANAVMNAGGPDNCSIVGNDLTLAYDDADGYRDRYPGIADTSTSFPTSAGCVP